MDSAKRTPNPQRPIVSLGMLIGPEVKRKAFDKARAIERKAKRTARRLKQTRGD